MRRCKAERLLSCLPAPIPPTSAAIGDTADEEAQQPKYDRDNQHVPEHVDGEAQASEQCQYQYKRN
jgi:hypothetical protein